jgi:hypothetical protein
MSQSTLNLQLEAFLRSSYTGLNTSLNVDEIRAVGTAINT